MQLVPFYTTFWGFLVFSGGVERDQWYDEMAQYLDPQAQ